MTGVARLVHHGPEIGVEAGVVKGDALVARQGLNVDHGEILGEGRIADIRPLRVHGLERGGGEAVGTRVLLIGGALRIGDAGDPAEGLHGIVPRGDPADEAAELGAIHMLAGLEEAAHGVHVVRDFAQARREQFLDAVGGLREAALRGIALEGAHGDIEEHAEGDTACGDDDREDGLGAAAQGAL